MDIFKIQSLITKGKIVSSADIDPENSYLQIGIYQPGNRKKGASDPNAYPAFAIPLSEVGGKQVIDVLGSTLYSTDPAAGPNFSPINSIFLGKFAGANATYAIYSNFFGQNAGADATNANYSNFIGESVGINATNANNSNFLGEEAGKNATNAFLSNFLGQYAGQGATDANDSNFFGYYAGQGAISANNSNFLGNNAGNDATNANNSNFFGNQAGYGAGGAYYSNFIGYNAGNGADTASYSNFIGYNAGKSSTGTNVTAIGINAGVGNGVPDVVILSNSQLQSFPDHVAAQAYLMTTGSMVPNNSYLFYNSTLKCIGVVRT